MKSLLALLILSSSLTVMAAQTEVVNYKTSGTCSDTVQSPRFVASKINPSRNTYNKAVNEIKLCAQKVAKEQLAIACKDGRNAYETGKILSYEVKSTNCNSVVLNNKLETVTCYAGVVAACELSL